MEVETTGNFMLVDIHGQQEIASSGKSDVKETAFVQTALNDGRLKRVDEPAEKEEPKSDNSPPTSGRGSKSTAKKAD